jgi:hypothetical protein
LHSLRANQEKFNLEMNKLQTKNVGEADLRKEYETAMLQKLAEVKSESNAELQKLRQDLNLANRKLYEKVSEPPRVIE